VYSEHCEIVNVLAHILRSDKAELKPSCLSLLSGLAKANGFKNYEMDFSSFVDTAIRFDSCFIELSRNNRQMLFFSLALDQNEPCLVRSEAISLISCLLNYNIVRVLIGWT
jgi:hypothetical protein